MTINHCGNAQADLANARFAGISVPVGCEAVAGVRKQPLASQIKSLAVGESATFPVEQRSSLFATASRIKKNWVRYGWDYRTEDNSDYTITITRTA